MAKIRPAPRITLPSVSISGSGTVGDVYGPESLLSLSSPSLTEGDSGTAVLRFVLSRASDGYPSISWSAETIAGGTATSGVDFTAFSDSGTITAGQSVNLDVEVIGDTDVEDDETVVMQVTGSWT